MNLRDMEIFRAVMLTGTVKGAGALLNISQPAASKLLALAERRSGLRLFERVKGRLTPTPEAHQLYPEIEAVWKTVAKARDVSRELAHPRGGSLRLVASVRFCTFLLPTTVTQLFNQYPDLGVRVEMIMPHMLNDALLNGIADLGVTMLPGEHPNLVTVRSYSCGVACAVPASHPLAKKKRLRPADLKGQRLIAVSKSPPFGQLIEQVFGEYLNDAHIHVETNSAPAACWLAQAGAGIAVLDTATVAGQTFAGIVARPLVPSPSAEVRILRNAYRPLSKVGEAFCEAFEQVWKQYVSYRSR
jgi:DNA-binding transcriptional LysR family regulator